MAEEPYFTSEGSGEAVLMLHGFGANKDTWNYVKPQLASKFQVFTLDLLGSGSAPKPAGCEYSLDEQADYVQTFIVRHKLENLTIVGSSYGGGIALLVASRYSEADESPLSGLVLIAGMAYKQKLPWYVSILRIPIVNRITSFAMPVEKQVQMVYKKVFYDDSIIPSDLAQSYANSLRGKESRKALIKMAQGIKHDSCKNAIQKYSEIDIPVLLLWGDHDEVIPLWVGEKLHDELPNAELQLIKNCGHAPHEERPGETARRILKFLVN